MNDLVQIQVVQLAVGLVFAYSGFAKLIRFRSFIEVIKEIHIVPAGTSVSVGSIVVGCEIIIGALHLSGYLIWIGVPLAMLLLISFAVAAGAVLQSGKMISCMCFGATEDTSISWKTLVRIGVLFASEVILAIEIFSKTSAVSTVMFAAGFLDNVLVAIVAILIISWALRVSDIRTLMRGCEKCGKAK